MAGLQEKDCGQDGAVGSAVDSGGSASVSEDRGAFGAEALDAEQAVDCADYSSPSTDRTSECRLYEMTKTDLTVLRARLLALRARLRGDMTQMEDIALNKDHNKTTSMPNHMAELGSGNFDQELTLSLLGSENAALDQIEAAIERIEDGTYGDCEECGAKIHQARLEAIPYAALCVKCASQREEGHGP